MAVNLENVKKVFLQNWGLKLIAFLLALLTFLAIHGVTSEETTREVPVKVNVEEGIAILDQDPPSVEVTFRGSEEDLRRLDREDLEVVIRPEATGSAESEIVSIKRSDVSGSIGARPVKISPNVVELTFDVEDEKQFSVAKPATVGTPLMGKIEVDYDPKTVKVRGPRRQLQRMLEKNVVIETKPIDVDGRAKSFTRSLPAIFPSETWVSRIEPKEIKVTVNIVTESISREWTNLAVRAITEYDLERNVDIQPPTVNLSLHGRPELVKSINTESIKVFVDCSGLDPSEEHELPVNVYLSPGKADVTVTVDPARVKVVFGTKHGEE